MSKVMIMIDENNNPIEQTNDLLDQYINMEVWSMISKRGEFWFVLKLWFVWRLEANVEANVIAENILRSVDNDGHWLWLWEWSMDPGKIEVINDKICWI